MGRGGGVTSILNNGTLTSIALIRLKRNGMNESRVFDFYEYTKLFPDDSLIFFYFNSFAPKVYYLVWYSGFVKCAILISDSKFYKGVESHEEFWLSAVWRRSGLTFSLANPLCHFDFVKKDSLILYFSIMSYDSNKNSESHTALKTIQNDTETIR